jgi:transcriptional regulator with GAF, ATPase, and Fis domain
MTVPGSERPAEPPQGAELEQGLLGLSTVLMGASPLSVTLTEVAAFAASSIPGADGVGLTMLEPAGPDTMVASTDFVRAVDEVQYGLGEGPCIEAVEVRRTQVCGSLGGEARWPRFGPRAGRMGVHSALSLPLMVAGQVVGALNVYGHRRDAFSSEAILIGEQFSIPAAVTVANARVLEQTRRLAQQLEQALGSRAVIDQAIGILMSRTGGSADEAFESLRSISRLEGTKVADVARTLVAQAVTRARARRAVP